MNYYTSILQLLIIWSMLSPKAAQQQPLPTTYEYFTAGGIESGLTANSPGFFKLNGKDLRILSGALHYFRVHPDLWRDRLKKLRAAGLNTVETYVPWNLHEPEFNVYDFGGGNNDFSMFLNVTRFLEIAQEEDLLVLFRPGPYICSEWDFGGLPSYLLKDVELKVRTSHKGYMQRFKQYFDNLLPLVKDLQFTKGGPIIAFQIENEYGSFSHIDKNYLLHIKQVFEGNGLDSLFFTSDGAWNGVIGALPEEGVLMTANFQSDPAGSLNALLKVQPDKPAMVMEFWAGWFDHWGEQHHTTPINGFEETLEIIFSKYNGSVNFYMFHGGTNFGFMAGANVRDTTPFYDPDVTSYDYDAPLSESGDYTLKYELVEELTEKYQVPALHRPERPRQSVKVANPPLEIQDYLTYDDILDQIPSTSKFNLMYPVSMEDLLINSDSGQSYGYILYRKVMDATANSNISLQVDAPVKDFGIVLVNGEIQPTPNHWINTGLEMSLTVPNSGHLILDILVENMGRVNFGNMNAFKQSKGLPGANIIINGQKMEQFETVALEFKGKWVAGLQKWRTSDDKQQQTLNAPSISRTGFGISGIPEDTFIDMTGWQKGIVFVNNFNIGRYWNIGPQVSLYVPAPLLKTGANTITVFEQFQAGSKILFSDRPNLGSVKPKKKN